MSHHYGFAIPLMNSFKEFGAKYGIVVAIIFGVALIALALSVIVQNREGVGGSANAPVLEMRIREEATIPASTEVIIQQVTSDFNGFKMWRMHDRSTRIACYAPNVPDPTAPGVDWSCTRSLLAPGGNLN